MLSGAHSNGSVSLEDIDMLESCVRGMHEDPVVG
jgi:hypothetical protein